MVDHCSIICTAKGCLNLDRQYSKVTDNPDASNTQQLRKSFTFKILILSVFQKYKFEQVICHVYALERMNFY